MALEFNSRLKLENLHLDEKSENMHVSGAAAMPNQKKKKKKKEKGGVPDRWLDYRPLGLRIPGTRFVAFKVPLKPALNRRVPESDSFGLWDLLDSMESQNQELGLIIDLTFTTRYYKLTDVPQSWSHIKILTEGHRVPSDAAILSFKRAVRQFLRENRDNDKLIGVHCTHGLNRTGYLVCRYLIDVDGLDPAAAVELFNSCRGHRMERQNYLKDLQRGARRSNDGIDEPEAESTRGLAVRRPPRTGSSTEGPQPGSECREDRPPSESDGREQRRPSTDVLSETKPAGERRPADRRRRRKAEHRSCGRGLSTPPSVPLTPYVWSPAPQPEAPKSNSNR